VHDGEGGLQGTRNAGVPVLDRHVEDGAGAVHGSAADEHIDAAEPVHCLVHGRGRAFLRGDVSLDGDAGAAGPLHSLDGRC
jgi:hypothetical protein